MGTLHNDQGFAREDHAGVTNFADLKSKVETFATANGFSLANDVLTGDLAGTVRGDVQKGKERVNIKLLSDTLSVGQRDNAGTLEGLTLSKDLSGLSYPLDLTIVVDSDPNPLVMTNTPDHTWTMDEANFSSGAADTPAPGVTAVDMDPGATQPISASGIFGAQDAADYNDAGWFELDDGGGNIPAALLPSGAWCFGGWMNFPTLPGIKYFMRASVSDPDRSFNMYFSATGGIGFNVYNDGTAANGKGNVAVDTTITTGKDYLIFFYYDGEAPRIFVGSDTASMAEVTYTAALDTYGTPTDINNTGDKAYVGTNNTQSIKTDRLDSVIYHFSGAVTLADMEKVRQEGAPIKQVLTKSDSSSLQLVTDEGAGTTVRHFYAGLANRERGQAQTNLKMAAGQTLASGNLTVTVELPKNDADEFEYPDIFNPAKPNFKPKMLWFSQTTTDSEEVEIASVANINTIAGTADITFSACTGSYGPDSLGGLSPQPLVLTEGLSGQSIEDGSVQSITVAPLGLPTTLPAKARIIPQGYGVTGEGEVTGRLLGLRGAAHSAVFADKSEYRTWKRPRSNGLPRLWEGRKLTSGDEILIPKTNY